MKARILVRAALGLCVGVLALSVPVLAQWTGEVAGGYIWQNATGNEDAFVTQFGQHQGFVLENFALAYAPKKDGPEMFAVKAFGFGGAEPAQHGSVFFKPNSDWIFNLDYNRQVSFFGLAGTAFSNERGQWAIERWKGAVVWDGWSAARLALTLRYTKRDGYQYRPVFGLATQYPMRNNYDQTMKEAAFRIDTKTLPVYLSFEQSFARYERQDRWAPAGAAPLFDVNTNPLVGLTTPRGNSTDVPTSRLIASYRNDRIEVAGSFLYSRADLDSTGSRTLAFDLQHGSVGQVQYIDNLVGSARQDTKAANVDAALQLGAGWSLRLAGDYRDATQDSNLLGAHILRMGRPGGTWREIAQSVRDQGFFDVKDTLGRIEVAKRGFGWGAWAGYQAVSRDVSYGTLTYDPNTKRTGDGWFLGGSWSRTPKLRISGEYQRGTFEHYVFRTNPELADRFTLRIGSRVGGGWQLGARARVEWAENPVSVAGVKRRSQSFGMTASWANKTGTAGFGFTSDMVTVDNRTNIFIIHQGPAQSLYNVDILALGANGHFQIGRVNVEADVTKLRDAGKTWPLTTWAAGVRAAIDGPKGTQFALFGQYRSYTEDYLALDNYYVTRYGVSLRWRF